LYLSVTRTEWEILRSVVAFIERFYYVVAFIERFYYVVAFSERLLCVVACIGGFYRVF